MPRISVIMSVYNQEDYLSDAINSILNQTYSDFEFIIVNDGSNDKSSDVINSFNDARIRHLTNDGNKGLIYSLNRAIKESNNPEFIARMDSDDISLPTRFEEQINYMEKNPDVGILGTAITFFGNDLPEFDLKYPLSNSEIVPSMLWMNPIAHPTVLIRMKHIGNLYKYDADFHKLEDYALWVNLIGKFLFCNLPNVLLKYRRHKGNVTGSYSTDQSKSQKALINILSTASLNANFNFTDEEIKVISSTSHLNAGNSLIYLNVDALIALINKLKFISSAYNLVILKKQLLRSILVHVIKTKRIQDFFKLIKLNDKAIIAPVVNSLITGNKDLLFK